MHAFKRSLALICDKETQSTARCGKFGDWQRPSTGGHPRCAAYRCLWVSPTLHCKASPSPSHVSKVCSIWVWVQFSCRQSCHFVPCTRIHYKNKHCLLPYLIVRWCRILQCPPDRLSVANPLLPCARVAGCQSFRPWLPLLHPPTCGYTRTRTLRQKWAESFHCCGGQGSRRYGALGKLSRPVFLGKAGGKKRRLRVEYSPQSLFSSAPDFRHQITQLEAHHGCKCGLSYLVV